MDHFEIPEELRIPRYGVKPWHDRDLLAEEAESAPERVFIACLAYDMPSVMDDRFWEGTAVDLERLLSGSEMPSARIFQKNFAWRNAVGTMLGRAAKLHPDLITKKTVRGGNVWKLDVNGIEALRQTDDVAF